MRRLVSCWFDGDPPGYWAKLARVLEHTARKNCPGWSIEVTELEAPAPSHRSAVYVANTRKLDFWAETVLGAKAGAEMLLMDTDTMILRPLDVAWSQAFDIAITVTDGTNPNRPAFNAGVVFLRASDKVKDFFAKWRDENRLMLEDPARFMPYMPRYQGINQSALGKLLETGAGDGLVLAQMPCSEWNCEDSAWKTFGEQTRIVHLKGALRRTILKIGNGTPESRPLAELWRQLEREAA